MKPIAIALPTLALLLGASVSAQDMPLGGGHVSFADGKALCKEVRLGDIPYSSYVVSEKGRLLDTSGADKSAELLAKVKSLNIHEPCRLRKGHSRHGDEIITIENKARGTEPSRRFWCQSLLSPLLEGRMRFNGILSLSVSLTPKGPRFDTGPFRNVRKN